MNPQIKKVIEHWMNGGNIRFRVDHSTSWTMWSTETPVNPMSNPGLEWSIVESEEDFKDRQFAKAEHDANQQSAYTNTYFTNREWFERGYSACKAFNGEIQ